MKALLSLLYLSLAGQALATDVKVLGALLPRVGSYVLSTNEPGNLCGHGRVETGKAVRLNVYQSPASSEFVEKGDLMVELEQWGENIEKWYPLFDRPAFFRINGWSKRYFMPLQGIWITHKTTYDHKTSVLQHAGSMSTLTGSQSGIQTIQFMDAGKKFVYSYEVVDYDAFGRVKSRQPAGRCEFTRKE